MNSGLMKQKAYRYCLNDFDFDFAFTSLIFPIFGFCR